MSSVAHELVSDLRDEIQLSVLDLEERSVVIMT